MRLRYILVLFSVLIVLGGVLYFILLPKDNETVSPMVYLWNITDNDISHITISLPKEAGSPQQSYIKISQGDAFPWFFDDEDNTPVDTQRWGGGIPLLLSGPKADRIITNNATSEQMGIYGLDKPSMVITITLTDKETLVINLGDATPNGVNYYIKAPYSDAVATVDSSWYQVLRKLVTDPPYVQTVSQVETETTTPAP